MIRVALKVKKLSRKFGRFKLEQQRQIQPKLEQWRKRSKLKLKNCRCWWWRHLELQERKSWRQMIQFRGYQWKKRKTPGWIGKKKMKREVEGGGREVSSSKSRLTFTVQVRRIPIPTPNPHTMAFMFLIHQILKVLTAKEEAKAATLALSTLWVSEAVPVTVPLTTWM